MDKICQTSMILNATLVQANQFTRGKNLRNSTALSSFASICLNLKLPFIFNQIHYWQTVPSHWGGGRLFGSQKGQIWSKICFLGTYRPWCPFGWMVGGCGARAVTHKTPIHFIFIWKKGQERNCKKNTTY